MRALVLVAGISLTACSRHGVPLPPSMTPRGHAASYALPSAAPAIAQALSACFAEPVTFSNLGPEPAPPGIDAREAECDQLGQQASDCRFDIANEYWQAGRFERAAPRLLAIAHDKDSTHAIDAAEMALVSIHFLGSSTDPPRSACFELLADEIPRLLTDLCDVPRANAERICAKIHIIDVDLTRCSECITSTVSGRPAARAYAAAANIHLSLATRECVLGQGKQAINETLRCEGLLFDAYTWFSKAGDAVGAAHARGMLLDPANGLREAVLSRPEGVNLMVE